MIIGAAKCGTTSLCKYLGQHESVFIPREKELHFFDKDEFYEKGIEEYKYLFRKSDDSDIVGEGTPNYFHEGKRVIDRISKIKNSHKIKFIVMFRNPVDRAWSHYLHQKRTCSEPLDFWTAIEKDLNNERNRYECRQEWRCYYRDGLYNLQLKPWLSEFDYKNFKFILLEDLKKDRLSVIRSIENFLSLSRSSNYNLEKKYNEAGKPLSQLVMKFLNKKSILKEIIKPFINRRNRKRINEWVRKKNYAKEEYKKPDMKKIHRTKLKNMYEKDIRNLQETIGRDLEMWI